ncbi:histidinol-phosphate aminotransferase [Clostridium novyi A str. 4552]|uniref:Histidinol-phosphate aminotransferase n=1 Tax=Clostridium novyi A str. 4552 TaxID=1444289 RepID=A0A0A0I6M6_CLONO|nr:histidinol-phosphate transaminase [Clostridium novyi]KGM95300.1 histidinol-phosphate aminotransferase [Clostridium novyi A str. 4552]
MIEELFRTDIKYFKPYDAKQEEYKIKLDANESFIELSQEIKDKIIRNLRKLEFNRYPDPDALELKKAYGCYIGIDEKNIMVGNGSDEFIQILASAFLDKNEKIVTLNPDFSMYKVYTEVRGGRVLSFDLNEDFTLNGDRVIQYINLEEPKMFIFSNPNNPTGGVIPKKDIIKIIENVKCVVVVDEAYMEFYGDSIVEYIKKYDNLIVLRTASKALGSAALRLGFLITNSTLLREIKKVKPPFNVNSVSQTIGKVILDDRKFIKESIDKVLCERNYLVTQLKSIEGLKVYETQSNFVLIYSENAKKINDILIKSGVKIRSFNDRTLKDFMRITVGSREENMEVINGIRGYI